MKYEGMLPVDADGLFRGDPRYFYSAAPILRLDQLPNRISLKYPFPQISTLNAPEAVADTYYGAWWTVDFDRAQGLYGSRSMAPGDHHIHVPYRAIPVEVAQSMEDLQSILQRHLAEHGAGCYVRGQNRLYKLARTGHTSTARTLYGLNAADEPSLTTSGHRRGLHSAVPCAAWTAALRLFVEGNLQAARDALLRIEEDEHRDKFQRLVDAPFERLRFASQALLQHYGAPSNGLDLTQRLDVALMFALYEFTSQGNVLTYRALTGTSEPPVLLLLKPHKRDTFSITDVGLLGLVAARPIAQDAHFFHTAWGCRANDAARAIVAAIELRSTSFLEHAAKPESCFPSSDQLGEYLVECRSYLSEGTPTELFPHVHFLST